MAANEYHFLTEWRVAAPREIIYEILRAGREHPRWWPEVYLEARLIPSNRDDHIGDGVEFLTKGRLPYRLRWTAETARLSPFDSIEVTASGDFVGQGVWNLQSQGEETLIRFDWRIRADKPILRWFSPVFKPIFSWNHRWAMDTGLVRLRAEAARRAGESSLNKQFSGIGDRPL